MSHSIDMRRQKAMSYAGHVDIHTRRQKAMSYAGQMPYLHDLDVNYMTAADDDVFGEGVYANRYR